MRYPYLTILLWCVTGFASVWLLVKRPQQWDTVEELLWLSVSLSMLLQLHPHSKNRLLNVAWPLYCFGLCLDLLDDFIASDKLPILLFDTSLKNIGFLLICSSLLLMLRDKRSDIVHLNNEIAERKQLEAKLTFEAYHDALTGLGNRRAYFEQFKALSRSHGYLFYFDLDHFKQANDKYGHQRGDQILSAFANSLQHHFAADLCFRLGGDEFVAFTSDDSIQPVKIRDHLLEQIFEFGVGVSIGVAKLAQDSDPDAILHQADEAMYRDKQQKNSRRCERP
ncbi:GGDEF domain-containing protein [Pseudoalteromonas fenneropenaei]|uniref:diguanylate cyclase n=1 Tax=Pseudoalteromonas fenneropenaei TaxID=1737459 RepID=A0ABV7CQA6_9GAMM